MKALFFSDHLEIKDDYPVPACLPGEALIRITMAGICGTDIEIMKGYKGFRGIPGHEFVGIVENAGNSSSDLTGKRVVGEINIGCGFCGACLSGMQRHCAERKVPGILHRDGCMAEYMTLPVRNLHPVPDSVPDESAVFAEPLAAALEITEQIHIKPDDTVLILGDGKLGMLIGLALGSTDLDITHAGKHPERPAVYFRSTHILHVNDLPDRKYDIVIEATGSPGGFETALRYTRPRGTLVLKSTTADRTTLDLTPVVVNEITVVGSRCGPFRSAIRALERGLPVSHLISAIYPFTEAIPAFAAAQEKGTLKVLLDMRNMTGKLSEHG